MDTIDLRHFQDWLRSLYDYISPNFYRAEPRNRAWLYLLNLALTSPDCHSRHQHVATYQDERRPDGAERLLTSARWDEDQVKADLLKFVQNRLSMSGGTLFATEAAFSKKGKYAAGVERQFNVHSSRTENCQVAILLFYKTTDGLLLLLDGELYLPEPWISDRARRSRAEVPPTLGYRSKPEIAAELLNRALEAGLSPQRVLVSVPSPGMEAVHKTLQRHGVQHVMALTPGDFIAQAPSQYPRPGAASRRWRRDGKIVKTLPEYEQWDGTRTMAVQLQWAKSATCPRNSFNVSYLLDSTPTRGARSSFSKHYYACSAHNDSSSLGEVVLDLKRLTIRALRIRDEAGVNRYEVRSWRGWHRHLTLAMITQVAMELSKMG